MKRFLFSVCALAAVVVGCSKSEVLNRPNAEASIEFNPYSGRVTETKATSADIATLGSEGFKVYAFLRDLGGEPTYDKETLHMDKDVTKSENSDSWVYPGKAYWPANGVLDFVAYGKNAGATLVDPDKYDLISYTVNPVVAQQKDLLVAQPRISMTHATSNNGVVDLKFYHLLTRIGFTLVTSENNTDVNVRITKVDLDGTFYSEGRVDLGAWQQGRPSILAQGQPTKTCYKLLDYEATTAETFTGLGTPNENGLGMPIFNNNMLYTVTNEEKPLEKDYIKKENPTTEETAQAEANLANRYMMIIPIEAAKHAAKLKVQYYLPCDQKVHEGEVDLCNIKVIQEGTETTTTRSIDFEPGKSYNFQFKVSTNKIDFSVAIEDWDTTNDGIVNQFPIM